MSVNLGLCQGAFKGIELCYSALECVSDHRLFPHVYLFLLVTLVAINFRILSQGDGGGKIPLYLEQTLTRLTWTLQRVILTRDGIVEKLTSVCFIKQVVEVTVPTAISTLKFYDVGFHHQLVFLVRESTVCVWFYSYI